MVITRHGRESAVLISTDDLEALEETLDVPASPEIMGRSAGSRADVESGHVLEAEDPAALMSEQRRDT
ncbi:type II toxin-antitoxin system Phd/YefM family antitoxin [Nocardiopsis dassonvillei]|uniref:type II toxin-antitoxin system Phd/YefM family antitoxin n=1 Tax=Nocardiopsis dassonvillei TaxID=2014 RepID=UPI003F568A03